MEKEFNELFEKKRKEIQLQVDNELDRIRRKYLIIELVFSIIGYVLIIYSVGFLLALGIWFATWGNNMSMVRTIFKNNINREIWKDQ